MLPSNTQITHKPKPRKDEPPEKINPSAKRIELNRWYTYKGAKVRFINIFGRPQPATNIHSTKSIREAHTILHELQTLIQTTKTDPEEPN